MFIYKYIMYYLPPEIVDIILEYAGHIRNRAGKYMKQLNVKDSKYNIVRKNIERKGKIIQEVKKETYFIMDRSSIIKKILSEMYPSPNPSFIKRIVYKTIHTSIPPYKTQFYYLWENFTP